MADEAPYITTIPGKPLSFFRLEGRPCVVYEEDSVRKAARFEPPDRFYPVDPWILDWGDIAGVAKPQPISEYSFALYLEIERQRYSEREKADADNPE